MLAAVLRTIARPYYYSVRVETLVTTNKNTSSWANFVSKREATKVYDLKSATFGALGKQYALFSQLRLLTWY